jgi:hypothetical protein
MDKKKSIKSQMAIAMVYNVHNTTMIRFGKKPIIGNGMVMLISGNGKDH